MQQIMLNEPWIICWGVEASGCQWQEHWDYPSEDRNYDTKKGIPIVSRDLAISNMNHPCSNPFEPVLPVLGAFLHLLF